MARKARPKRVTPVRYDPLGSPDLDGRPIMLRLSRADRARLEDVATRPPWSEAPYYGQVAVIARACVRFAWPQLDAAPDHVRAKAGGVESRPDSP